MNTRVLGRSYGKCGSAVLLGLVVAGVMVPPRAAVEAALYEEMPFDRITLNAENGNAVLTVAPIKFPGGRVPDPLPDRGKLVVQLTDRARQDYDVLWAAIERIETFDQMVLQEARQQIQAGDLEEAFDSLAYLRQRENPVAGLDATLADFLYESAKRQQREDRPVGALAMLRELHRLDPGHPHVESAMGTATDTLIERYCEKDDYQSARVLIDELRGFYPKHAVVKKWEDAFQDEAETLFDEARRAEERGEFRTALVKASRIPHVLPGMDGVEELIESISRQYRRVIVGVMAHPRWDGRNRIDDWEARRASRLTDRAICEFVGAATEGGQYRCPLGEVSVEELGRVMAFRLRPGLQLAGGESTLSGYDLSRWLLEMANRGDGQRFPGWADLFQAVSVREVFNVDVELRRTCVRPEAFLRVDLSTLLPGAKASTSHGPYSATEPDGEDLCYLMNPEYGLGGAGRPQEIVERRFRNGGEAIWALREGHVDVVDRVPPWQVESVRADNRLSVQRYAVPLVHCLVPNMNKPLMTRRAFRRALLFGIQREAILQSLIGSAAKAGCRVISGPFSAGFALDDPLAYGYDPSIIPRTYDPRLSMALCQVSAAEMASKLRGEGKEVPDASRLVLAYPPDDIARLACNAIKRNWELLDLKVELVELGGDEGEVPEAADLVYTELAMWEPLVDARRVLGPDGVVGSASPYMAQALNALDRATNWPDVGTQLRNIHRVAHTEVTVLPLWQLTDYYAYRNDVRGIRGGLVTLYQEVENWRVPMRVRAAREGE